MKRKPRSSGGGANWMDTYGDMVTLLLCFFVLLYSMSSINQDKWKAIVMSFNPNAEDTETVTSGNDGPVADPVEDGIGLDSGLVEATDATDEEEELSDRLLSLYEALSDYADQESGNGEITVTQGDGKIFISFNQTVFFDGDSYYLRQEAYPVLDHVCSLLDETVDSIDEVRILGHTSQAAANAPNIVDVDRRLASDRAVSVVIYLQEHSQLSPARLISEGIGQWRPIASNDTEESRAKNRRVEMIISGRNLEEALKEDQVASGEE